MVWVFRGMGLRQIPEPMAIPVARRRICRGRGHGGRCTSPCAGSREAGTFQVHPMVGTRCSAAVGQKRRVKKKYPGGRSFCKTPLPKPAPDPDPGDPHPLVNY